MSSFGQYIDHRDIKNVGVTAVIKEGAIGEAFKKAVEENWTATNYKFITEKDLLYHYELISDLINS